MHDGTRSNPTLCEGGCDVFEKAESQEGEEWGVRFLIDLMYYLRENHLGAEPLERKVGEKSWVCDYAFCLGNGRVFFEQSWEQLCLNCFAVPLIIDMH